MKLHFLRKIYLNEGKIKVAIENQTREDKDIIYGGQSIKKRLGAVGRKTRDYDIFSKKPKLSARKIEKKLDKVYGMDAFYVKPAEHPETIKVMHIGIDKKAKTKDDYNVIDYSPTPKPTPRFDIINGIRYRKLSAEKKAKLKSLKDKEYEFRHPKDKEDLQRIKFEEGFI